MRPDIDSCWPSFDQVMVAVGLQDRGAHTLDLHQYFTHIMCGSALIVTLLMISGYTPIAMQSTHVPVVKHSNVATSPSTTVSSESGLISNSVAWYICEDPTITLHYGNVCMQLVKFRVIESKSYNSQTCLFFLDPVV